MLFVVGLMGCGDGGQAGLASTATLAHDGYGGGPPNPCSDHKCFWILTSQVKE